MYLGNETPCGNETSRIINGTGYNIKRVCFLFATLYWRPTWLFSTKQFRLIKAIFSGGRWSICIRKNQTCCKCICKNLLYYRTKSGSGRMTESGLRYSYQLPNVENSLNRIPQILLK